MSLIHRCSLAFTLLLAALPACGEQVGGDYDQLARDFASSAPQEIPEAFSALLPDDTLFYMQARSPSALAHALVALMGGTTMPSPLGAPDAGAVLAMFSPNGGLLASDVDLEKPVGFALAWPEGVDEPLLMTLFHRTEFSDIEARLDEQFVFAREGRATRMLLRTSTDESSLAPRSGESQVGSRLAAGELSAWVDLQTTLSNPRVLASYDGMVALGKMTMNTPQPGMPDMEGMRDMIDLTTIALRESFSELAQLDVGLRAQDGVLQLHGELHVFADSPLADIPAPTDADLGELYGLLDADAAARSILRVEFSDLRARSVPLLTTLALEDEALAELFGQYLASMDAFAGTMAMQMRTSGAMQVRSYLKSDDPEASRDDMVRMLPAFGETIGSVIYEDPESIEVDGHEVVVMRIDEASPIASMTADDPFFPSLAEQTAGYFVHDGLVVTVQGADIPAQVRSAIDTIDAREPGNTQNDAALAAFDAVGAGAYMRLDFAEMIRGVAELAGIPMPDDDAQALIIMFLGNSGPRYTLDVSFDVGSMMQLMEPPR
ncbi:MAG: hypothetical protein DHS20C15_28710 [Planctomycetota bacterium]|nr:MAG: hypothetical protein DHS20C15_28710 [Planctomycetota bacterium]